jgi:hypothetical protein
MDAKDAVTGAAIAVLLAILGLVIMIGLILLMMWKQPGIEHSPSQASLCVPIAEAQLSLESQPLRKASVTQCCGIFGSEA